MHIHVKLYSNLKTYAPGKSGQFDLTLSPGATLEEVCSQLGIPVGIPENLRHTALINGRRAGLDSILKKEDTLVMFPEICGG